MKIIMFGHKRIPSREGGVEIVVDELSTRMAAMGHDVVCYNRKGHHVSGAQYDGQSFKEYKGVKIKNVFTINRKGLAAATSSISAAICSAFSRADVVHIHAEGPAFLCWLPKLFGKRIVVTVHGLDWQREKWRSKFAVWYIHTGEKAAVRFADEIIVLSRNVQKYFKDTYNRDTVWVANGVDAPEYMEPKEITEQFGVEKDGYILFLGRLVPEKGIHYLIKAFRKVDTDKKLVIAGGASDESKYVRKLRELASGDDRIIFTDFVQGRTLNELLTNNYMFVLPSNVEGMPLCLLEAMASGSCCVVSDIPECSEVVEDSAMVFPRGSVDDLRECLQKLCDDENEVKKYREKALRRMSGNYTWDGAVERTLELYSRKRKD